MKSVNKVILLGTLGRDPEVRYVAANTVPVVRISLATNERYKDEQGNWQDRTEWHYGRGVAAAGRNHRPICPEGRSALR